MGLLFEVLEIRYLDIHEEASSKHTFSSPLPSGVVINITVKAT